MADQPSSTGTSEIFEKTEERLPRVAAFNRSASRPLADRDRRRARREPKEPRIYTGGDVVVDLAKVREAVVAAQGAWFALGCPEKVLRIDAWVAAGEVKLLMLVTGPREYVERYVPTHVNYIPVELVLAGR